MICGELLNGQFGLAQNLEFFLRVLIAGLFYGALMYGGTRLTLVGASSQLINVIVGTVVFFIAISVIFSNLKYLKRKPKASGATNKKG